MPRTREWSGLTGIIVAELMGCGQTKARKLLQDEKLRLGKPLTLDDIGRLIYEQRYKKETIDAELDRFLSKSLSCSL